MYLSVVRKVFLFSVFLCSIFCVRVMDVYLFHVCGVKRCFFCLVYVQWPSVCCILYVLYVLCLYVEVESLLDLRFS